MAKTKVLSQPDIGRSHVFLRPTAAPRVIDMLLGVGGAVIGTTWTATRSTLGGRLAWGIGQVTLGGIVGMEAFGTEVGSFASGVAFGNAADLALTLFHPDLRN